MAYFNKSAWVCSHHRLIFAEARVNRRGFKTWRFNCGNTHPTFQIPCVKHFLVIANMWAPKLLGKPAPMLSPDGSLDYSEVTMSA